jgi:hypothetical protein
MITTSERAYNEPQNTGLQALGVNEDEWRSQAPSRLTLVNGGVRVTCSAFDHILNVGLWACFAFRKLLCGRWAIL